MSSFYEPNYWLLSFLMLRSFAFVEIIALLGLIRAGVARGPSRVMAALSFALGALGVAAKYVPPLAGLSSHDIGRAAAHLLLAGQSMALPFAVTLLFLASSLLRGRRWWGLDLIFWLFAALFYGLWIYTLL